jgi:hypothetical protein
MDAAALAAAIGGPIVGLAGMALAWRLALAEREHALRLARGQRMFEARGVAYRGLLRELYRVRDWVHRTLPFLGPKPAPPEPPTDDDWNRMFAEVAVFGSEELLTLFETFSAKVRGFQTYAFTYDQLTKQEAPLGDSGKLMEQYRQEASAALEAIERLMRTEIAGL